MVYWLGEIQVWWWVGRWVVRMVGKLVVRWVVEWVGQWDGLLVVEKADRKVVLLVDLWELIKNIISNS